MHSCLYEGRVAHRRKTPGHEFRYRLFLLLLDLDELDEVFRGRWLWSTRHRAIAEFRRGDHLGESEVSLKESVGRLLEERLGFRPEGAVRLLTHLRYWGFVMNPVSFFYCFDSQGNLQALVAEVNNTPWGERHSYVLDLRDQGGGVFSSRNRKEFHVSPFLGMEMEYDWKVTAPGEEIEVSIENYSGEEKVFAAELSLQRREIDGWSLARVLTWYPWMTLKVLGGIYWEAFRLWWKGCRYYPHPAAISDVGKASAGETVR